MRGRDTRTEVMKQSRFTAGQSVAILKKAGAGLQVAEGCRKHGISQPTN